MKRADEVVLTFRDGRTMIATVVVDPVALANFVGRRAAQRSTKRATLGRGAVVVTVHDNPSLPATMRTKPTSGAEIIMQQLNEPLRCGDRVTGHGVKPGSRIVAIVPDCATLSDGSQRLLTDLTRVES